MHFKKVHYLAVPYTHASPEVQLDRFNIVTNMAVELFRQDVFVFSPISYNVPWKDYNLPTEFKYWRDFDLAFLSRMDSIVVLTLDGWGESIGVNAEVDYAASIGLPIFYVSPEQIESGELKDKLSYHGLI